MEYTVCKVLWNGRTIGTIVDITTIIKTVITILIAFLIASSSMVVLTITHRIQCTCIIRPPIYHHYCCHLNHECSIFFYHITSLLFRGLRRVIKIV